MFTRREILKVFGMAAGFSFLKPLSTAADLPERPAVDYPLSTIFRSVNGSPSENIGKVIDLLGGIEAIVDKSDVVVIKPNVQWWNQGAPNLSAVHKFVDLIMDRPGGFDGEVVIAENCHRGNQPWNYAGWQYTFKRNASIPGVTNFNDLAATLKKLYGDRYSTVHWINVQAGAKRVYSPKNGFGYVYCDGTNGTDRLVFGNGIQGDGFRETIMTYPIFGTDRGTTIDYKYGIWQDGNYDNKRLKFINFAALNHHSTYCGMTSLIKNYLGVSDLSGGPDPFDDGKLTDQYYNFHSFPFNKWAPGPQPGMIGAEIGVFFEAIRRPDLNIVTAEWIGLADRIKPPVARTRAVLASTDPVALDFHSAKYLLHPNSRIPFHDPESPDSPTYQYIKACADQGGGEFDERRVNMVSYDHRVKGLQTDEEAAVFAEKEWGAHVRTIGKYLLMRYGSFLL